jgi:SAM-dependent methyltransferase
MMPARVIALDIRESCARALARQSSVRPLLGHAAYLPIATGSVGTVYQSLMLSSVLDAALRRRIYAEIARVLAPGGWFLSYDTRYPNPWNPNTRPVLLAELRDAFAGWRQRHRTLTGLPPLIRWLAPLSRTLCRALEAIPPLRSHRLFLAEKRGEA